eukprot:scaffold18819_cov268-Amphora_coffeaeformis.AAC.2
MGVVVGFQYYVSVPIKRLLLLLSMPMQYFFGQVHDNFRCGKDLQGKGKNNGNAVQELHHRGQDTVG